ncbi:MAG TPA: N-acetylmuramoyl-L-alanine amidase [Opitutaceae bacterium]
MLASCRSPSTERTFVPRKGDEIMVAGQLFHTGTRVITWMDPGGYDAYRVERRFSPYAESGWEQSQEAVKELTSPNRYGLRAAVLDPETIERVRGGGWELAQLQAVVDQFVVHYDACGLSKICFNVLHDHRGLSIHFMLDLDGTIYQTLDLKERAWHATTSNSRSIGIEIAHVGAFAPGDTQTTDRWYGRRPDGGTVITIPASVGDPRIHTPGFIGRPARGEPVTGVMQGQTLVQYDFTPEQYAALIKLTAALTTVFPKITLDAPRGPDGRVLTTKLPDDELAAFQGVIGHHHIQANKIDPGPAFDWDRVIDGAKALRKKPEAVSRAHRARKM